MVLKNANTVNIQMSLKTQDPMIIMNDGTKVLPRPRAAATDPSIKAEIQKEKDMMKSFFIPASTTALSLVNMPIRALPLA